MRKPRVVVIRGALSGPARAEPAGSGVGKLEISSLSLSLYALDKLARLPSTPTARWRGALQGGSLKPHRASLSLSHAARRLARRTCPGTSAARR